MFYNRAKFQNNLRGSVENTCWIDMEWPMYPYISLAVIYGLTAITKILVTR